MTIEFSEGTVVTSSIVFVFIVSILLFTIDLLLYDYKDVVLFSRGSALCLCIMVLIFITIFPKIYYVYCDKDTHRNYGGKAETSTWDDEVASTDIVSTKHNRRSGIVITKETKITFQTKKNSTDEIPLTPIPFAPDYHETKKTIELAPFPKKYIQD